MESAILHGAAVGVDDPVHNVEDLDLATSKEARIDPPVGGYSR